MFIGKTLEIKYILYLNTYTNKNIINALKTAKAKGIKTIGFLGNKGGKAKRYCDIDLIVPSSVTARIQECHIFLGHYILEKTENRLFHK